MILDVTWHTVFVLAMEALCVFSITYVVALRTRVSSRAYSDVSAAKKNLEEKLQVAQHENESLRQEVQALQLGLQDAKDRALVLEVEKRGLEKAGAQLDSFLKLVDEQCKVHFENLANRIFDEKVDKLSKISREGLSGILEPVKENMKVLKRELEEAFIRHGKEQFSLKNEIQRIVLANEKITLQAEGLTNALKGEAKIQGNWGEVVLERVLEDSGLRRGQDYKLYGAGMDLRGVEGGKQYPDVVILLPGGKHIIVDSKVSLVHYEKYCSDRQEGAQSTHLKHFVNSIRSHINDLSSKRYSDMERINAPDFVLMFIPIESAYFLAVQADAELHKYAWYRKIVVVCPSTLLATLKTVESLWKLEHQNRNTLEIARQGGALYDKIASFIQDMQKLGKQIDVAGGAYRDAMKKLSEGHGNILARTQTLKNLGVRTSKSIEADVTDG
ncbi:DNA recombination protein RmuC [Anaplasma capra]|uniref:DNA recombination protein RmuC n=1 Tax=Anaplasma capra TaxID=1562740 RepID=UPI0021D5889E|nr:DNA recombination protein RmuC [Anaplasma capra]MCU7611580.1 DNA recombination protein RmuC [Anaplasma capra]MCU7611981.1 DNA recombination protein RmuC [Anaplasma capra]